MNKVSKREVRLVMTRFVPFKSTFVLLFIACIQTQTYSINLNIFPKYSYDFGGLQFNNDQKRRKKKNKRDGSEILWCCVTVFKGPQVQFKQTKYLNEFTCVRVFTGRHSSHSLAVNDIKPFISICKSKFCLCVFVCVFVCIGDFVFLLSCTFIECTLRQKPLYEKKKQKKNN